MVVHHKFCPLCGSELVLKNAGDDGLIPYCESCGKMWFDAFPCCIIAISYNEYNEIAMTLQPHLTEKHWVFTTGFITPGETAEEAAAREIKEELGLNIERMENGGSYWYRKGGMLMLAFFAFVRKTDFTLSDEVQCAEWVSLDKAIELMGPVRQGCADFKMMKEFVRQRGLCDPDSLWPGEEL